MKLEAFIGERLKVGVGAQILAQAAVDALGGDAEVVEGAVEVRMEGGKVQFWRLLLLAPEKLLDFRLSPLESPAYDQRALLKVDTYPLRHILQVNSVSEGSITGASFAGKAAYTVVFVPGHGLMDIALPPQQQGLNLDPADAASYRRVGAHLLKMLS